MIIKQHTSTFPTSFSSTQTKQEETTKNKFVCETLTQHNLQNTKPFSKPKPLMNSALRDLSKACNRFKNNGTRKFTKVERQMRCSGCLVLLAWNRCPLRSQMMNDEGPLACGCLVWPQTWTVMAEAFFKTVLEQVLPGGKWWLPWA